MKQDKWVKRYYYTKKDGEGEYVIAIDKDGNWGCSCPAWKFRRIECHHIQFFKANGGIEIKPKSAQPGNVGEG